MERRTSRYLLYYSLRFILILLSATIDIVLPCYNPAEGWGISVVDKMIELREMLPEVECRLIVVDDGSSTGVNDVNIQTIKGSIPLTKVIRCSENQGKGAALRKGIKSANADYIIYTDVDFPYTLKSLLAIYNDLLEGFDIVAGIKDDTYYHSVPAGRRFISRFLRGMTRLFLGLKITDTQCGLKGMNAKGRDVFLSTTIDRYLFDLEFIYLASHNKEIQLTARTIQLRDSISFSKMPLKILVQEGFNFVRIIFKRFA